MAQSTDLQARRHPLAAFNFRVKVAETSMGFTEVSGIGVEYAHVVYKHGLSFREGARIETVAVDRFRAVTCKRGTILGASPLFLHEWLTRRDLRTMEVSLCDGSGAAVLSWKIRAAVPVKLMAPSFTAAGKDVAVDSLELQAKGISVVEL